MPVPFASLMVPIDRLQARVLDSAGAGPVVLILASPLINADLYRPTLAALTPQWRVLVAELPGSGAATQLAAPYTTSQLADLVPPLLEALGIDSVAQLVGHSSAGAIALQVAVRHPRRLQRLVLADSSGGHPPAPLLAVLAARALDGLLEWRLTLAGAPALLANLRRHRRSFLRHLRDSREDALLLQAPQVSCPVLLAWGGRDHTMPLASARRFLAALPAARLLVLPDGSHDWLIEYPQAFAHALGIPGTTALEEWLEPARPASRLARARDRLAELARRRPPRGAAPALTAGSAREAAAALARSA
ncbi:MAG: alpha/beta fold hydrolase [Pseudomonadota bacterium]